MDTLDPPITSSTKIHIPFHDVDSLNIVWHGHYVRYLEIARCELLSLIGYNYDSMKKHGHAWPIVDIRIKYIKPAAFDQKVVVQCKLEEWENRIKISYEIFDETLSTKLCKASTTQMAIDMQSGETLFESPKILLDLVKKYVSLR